MKKHLPEKLLPANKQLKRSPLFTVLLLTALLCFCHSRVHAQARNITGKVTGEKGEALPGVTVLLKGTTTGTATDPDGMFALPAPAAGGTLVISFIGYTTQEVAINNRTVINIGLEPDVKALKEVVVIGHGTQAKSDITGALPP